jgi:hypothetical protein
LSPVSASADPQQAFRAGLRGEPRPGAGTAPARTDGGGGPNQSVMLETVRMGGLVDAQGAFETGRVLRRIGWLLDRAGAPAAVGRQFRDNVAAAVMTHHLRRRPEPWGAADTVAMFMELYGRILGTEGSDFARVRDALLSCAREETGGTAPPAGQMRSPQADAAPPPARAELR